MRSIGIFAVATVSALAVPLNAVTPVNGVVAAAADVVANADAAVANIGIKGSDVADNIGSNNHVDVLPRDLVTVGALVEALANALAEADVSLKAVLANVNVQDSSLITNILNDNKITVLRRDGITLPANIDAIVLALIDAAVAAAVANIGIDYSTLLSNIGNNNVIFVRSLPETVDIAALVKAIADACAKVGADVNALIANINIENSSVLTDILNGNKVIAPVRRDGVILPANIDAIVLALIDAAVAASVDVQAAVANIGIDYSTLVSNIGNNNVVFIRSLPETVDIAALVKAIADACAKVGVDVNALIANINIENSSVLTDILNGNKVIAPIRRDGIVLPANIDAVVLALIDAVVAAGVNVQAAVANIGIDYSTLLSNIGNNNVVFIRSLPETVDIAALVKAIADACAKVGVDINALIANLNIENSSILTDILNGNKISVLRRDLGIPLITADVLAVLQAIVTAALDAQVDVFASALNAGLDCVTILSNILNNNTVQILPIFLRRDASLLDIYSTVLALVQALVSVGVPVDIFALNAFIKDSNIGTNILNDNIISILGI
ncbi:hypothetical protein M422DRAFT_257137 [Sphaerobolus stellatus SS14]|uniref:Uncharacterized protein n=1 Tax=Sphaerobolus stellatus (strain SS14) TaxID=990650 RepID=A0A0C9UYV0_SPHS4|nr:hypothetical protein M422DRAFT_257137 [Sphaerobolus stellatus SS14]